MTPKSIFSIILLTKGRFDIGLWLVNIDVSRHHDCRFKASRKLPDDREVGQPINGVKRVLLAFLLIMSLCFADYLVLLSSKL